MCSPLAETPFVTGLAIVVVCVLDTLADGWLEQAGALAGTPEWVFVKSWKKGKFLDEWTKNVIGREVFAGEWAW